jgi:predicted  nucleic acid-binding Zn-ribbon protein
MNNQNEFVNELLHKLTKYKTLINQVGNGYKRNVYERKLYNYNNKLRLLSQTGGVLEADVSGLDLGENTEALQNLVNNIAGLSPASLEVEYNALVKTHDDVFEKLKAIEEMINKLIDDYQRRISELEAAQDSAAGLTADLATANATLTTTQADLDRVNAEIAVLRPQVDTLRSEATPDMIAAGELAGLQGERNLLKLQESELKARVAQLEEELRSANARIADLETEVARLEALLAQNEAGLQAKADSISNTDHKNKIRDIIGVINTALGQAQSKTVQTPKLGLSEIAIRVFNMLTGKINSRSGSGSGSGGPPTIGSVATTAKGTAAAMAAFKSRIPSTAPAPVAATAPAEEVAAAAAPALTPAAAVAAPAAVAAAPAAAAAVVAPVAATPAAAAPAPAMPAPYAPAATPEEEAIAQAEIARVAAEAVETALTAAQAAKDSKAEGSIVKIKIQVEIARNESNKAIRAARAASAAARAASTPAALAAATAAQKSATKAAASKDSAKKLLPSPPTFGSKGTLPVPRAGSNKALPAGLKSAALPAALPTLRVPSTASSALAESVDRSKTATVLAVMGTILSSISDTNTEKVNLQKRYDGLQGRFNQPVINEKELKLIDIELKELQGDIDTNLNIV